jgi:O-antigen ligase
VQWSATDWLSRRGELAAEIARVRERDANGHVAHAIVATLAIFMQPIANAPANIGFGMLVAMCALRVHRLWRVWALMFREPFWLLLVAWAAWTGITLLWSEDVAYGARQWGGFRAILWVPMLWPVIDRWRWLVGALLAGVACANGLQVSQYFGGWPTARPGKLTGGGFHMYVFMGAWCAIAFAIWTMMAVSLRWKAALASVAFASLAAIGLVIAGTRGSLVGAGVEVIVIAALLAVRQRGWVKRAAVRAAVGAVILAVVWLVVGEKVQQKFDALVVRDTAVAAGTAGTTTDAPQTVASMRLNMQDGRMAVWRFAIRQWQQAPWSGVGFGTVLARAKSVDEHEPGLEKAERKGVVELGHPHSTSVQTLAETGLIGFALYASWVISALWIGWRLLGADRPPNCPQWLPPALLGAALAFFVASQFDCYQMNSTAFAIGLLPIGLLSGLRWLTR